MPDGNVFFDKTYDETMAMLIEARDYAAYQEPTDRRTLATGTRLQASYESMRVTSRLTQVMAWLLAQKAVYAGEMTAQEAASEHFALAGGRHCADPSGNDNQELPCTLQSLLRRSHSLYMRVGRLEQMFQRSATASKFG